MATNIPYVYIDIYMYMCTYACMKLYCIYLD